MVILIISSASMSQVGRGIIIIMIMASIIKLIIISDFFMPRTSIDYKLQKSCYIPFIDCKCHKNFRYSLIKLRRYFCLYRRIDRASWQQACPQQPLF